MGKPADRQRSTANDAAGDRVKVLMEVRTFSNERRLFSATKNEQS
jgi:hypothetical protein